MIAGRVKKVIQQYMDSTAPDIDTHPHVNSDLVLQCLHVLYEPISRTFKYTPLP